MHSPLYGTKSAPQTNCRQLPHPPPTVSGNIETQSAHISGSYEYQTHFHNHGWRVHSPFTNTAVRNRRGKGGNVTDGSGANRYAYSISAKEVHPADGYDGEQGGSFPAPTGARDEYSYAVSGSVWRSRVIDPQKAPCTANGSCFTDSRTENRQEDWSWRDSGTPTQTPDNRRDDSVRSAYAQGQEARNNTGYSSRESWFNHSDRPYRAPTDLGDLTRGIGKFRELQAQYNGIKGMGTAELAEMGRTAGNGFGSAAERWGNLTAKLPEDIRGFAAHTGLYAEYQSRRLWDYEKKTADKAGRDVSKSLQGMFAPSNPYRSWGGNTAKRASAALYGVQAYGNYSKIK